MSRLTIRNGMTPEEDAYIKTQLRAYNLQKAPPSTDYPSKEVSLILEDGNGYIGGGLIGKIYRKCLFVDVLWVSEKERGHRYGHALLAEAEGLAKREGCTFSHLDTFSFQAPNFYKKNGYEVYGVLDLYFDGVKRYYLKKKLHAYDVIYGEEIDIRIQSNEGVDLSDRWHHEYRFDILLHNTDTVIGYVNARIGDVEPLNMYHGHIGYGIDSEYRGHKYAAKACELVKRVFLDHHVRSVIITCNPENSASKAICASLGAQYINTIDIPFDSEAYSDNETQKCRYEWTL